MLQSSGPRHEKETVIRLCEGEPEAEIWTASSGFFTKLLSRGYAPFSISKDERSATFRIPKKAVSIRRPRGQREAS